MFGWLSRISTRPSCVGGRWLLVVGVCAALGCTTIAGSERVAPSATAATAANFDATLHFDAGAVQIAFDSQAAPQAVAELKRAFASGAFDNVAVDWIRPHTEIRTAAPATATAAIDSELDALALGLDQIRIEDAGAAMNLIQMELEPALLRAGSDASPQLLAWVSQWRQQFDPAFLIGVSRQQINEALGYRYQRGYASKPVRRGSVALVPGKPGQTSLALAIVLRDQPARDGRWVVVGHVVTGLDVAERLAIAPRVHPKFYQPRTPILIVGTRLSPSRR